VGPRINIYPGPPGGEGPPPGATPGGRPPPGGLADDKVVKIPGGVPPGSRNEHPSARGNENNCRAGFREGRASLLFLGPRITCRFRTRGGGPATDPEGPGDKPWQVPRLSKPGLPIFFSGPRGTEKQAEASERANPKPKRSVASGFSCVETCRTGTESFLPGTTPTSGAFLSGRSRDKQTGFPPPPTGERPPREFYDTPSTRTCGKPRCRVW